MKTYDHTWLIAEWHRMGKPEVEYLYCDGLEMPVWTPSTSVIFYDDIQYRIKSKPWINWEHVSDDVVAMSTDEDGDTLLFHYMPEKNSGWWFAEKEGFLVDAKIFSSFTPGTCDWRDSLVMRPVVVS